MADNPAPGPWYRNILRPSGGRPRRRDVIRVTVSIVGALAGGIVAGRLAAGILASVGALLGAIAPQRGPLAAKVGRTAAGLGAGVLGMVIGRYAAGGGWAPVVLIALVAAAAAMASAVSANLSFASLQVLVYIAVGSGLRVALPVPERLGLFLAGGLWSLTLTLVEALTDPVDPDRAVVAEVLEAVARLLAASGPTRDRDPHRELVGALNRAYDQIGRSRSFTPGRSLRLTQLAAVLNSAALLCEGTVAQYRSGRPAEPDDIRIVRELASAVSAGAPPPGPPPEEGGPSSAAPARAVREGIRAVWSVLDDEPPAPVGSRPVTARRPRIGRLDLAQVAGRTVRSPASRQFAVRLALCMSVAEVVRQDLPTSRPYWVVLTVAIVLKPDFGSVFARAVQRTIGTLIGVVLGAAVLVMVPHDAWMLIPMAIAVACMPWGQAANYGLFTVALTPVVVILLDLGAPTGWGVVTARLEDTCVGSGIVLIFGYLLWPSTWRSSLDRPLKRVIAALAAHLDAAFRLGPEERRPVRRQAYRALSELQTELQRQFTEPPPVSRRAARAWPLAVQLERLADAIVEAGVALDSGARRPPTETLDRLQHTLERALEVQPALDPDTADSGDGPLTPVARELAAVLALTRAEGQVVDREGTSPAAAVAT